MPDNGNDSAFKNIDRVVNAHHAGRIDKILFLRFDLGNAEIQLILNACFAVKGIEGLCNSDSYVFTQHTCFLPIAYTENHYT